MTIVGTREDLSQLTGSAQVIDTADIERFAYSDIQRLIRQVPGVSVQIEDGYGLRPNLSIRGVATERSSRITLMEDGVRKFLAGDTTIEEVLTVAVAGETAAAA